MTDEDASLTGLAYTLFAFARVIVDQTGVDKASTAAAVRFLSDALPGNDDTLKQWTKLWAEQLAEFVESPKPPTGPELRMILGGKA